MVATAPEYREPAGRCLFPLMELGPLDRKSKARIKTYPFAALLHKESLEVFAN